MSKYYLTQEDYLQHYGIPKMKWGIRRYQNEDGTYTEEGKARRRKSDSYSDDYKHFQKLRKTPSNQLSNKELQDLNNRYNLEQQRKNYEKRGKTWIGTVANKFKEQSAQAIAGALVAAGVLYLKKHRVFPFN